MGENDNYVDSALVDGPECGSEFLKDRRRLTKKIVQSFQIRDEDYEARDTIQTIKEYLAQKDEIGRLLYSEITTTIFLLEEKDRGQIQTNITKLIEEIYSEDNAHLLDEFSSEEKIKYKQIILKIYDHVQLATYQIHNITEEAVEQSKKQFEDKMKEGLKKAERNYVAILGIFASIITAAMGGFNYVAKVFDAVDKLNYLPTLIGLTTIIGMVLVTLTGLMTKLIFHMEETKWSWLDITIPCFLLMMAGSIMYWLAK